MGEVAAATVTLDSILDQALQLSPLDRVRLIERVAALLEHDLSVSRPSPLRSFRGILADLGPAPSAEEIDEARREAWANFPRDDI